METIKVGFIQVGYNEEDVEQSRIVLIKLKRMDILKR